MSGGQRTGRHVRQRVYPTAEPPRGAHTGGLSRESHATPGFKIKSEEELRDEGLLLAGGLAGSSLELCRPMFVTSGASAEIGDTASAADDSELDLALTVDEADGALYIAIMANVAPTLSWFPSYENSGTPGAASGSFTLLDSEAVNGLATMFLYRMLDPALTVQPTSAVRVVTGIGVRFIVGIWYVKGVDQSQPERGSVAVNTGTGATSSVTVDALGNDLIIDFAGWAELNSTNSTPVEAGDQTSDFAHMLDRSFGFTDYSMGGSHGSDATPAWNFTNSHGWTAMAVAVQSSAPEIISDGDANSELIRDGERASRCGHRHDLHRDTAPTVDDDERLGYPVGTTWAQLDDLVTPTEIVSVWFLADASEGAAVWLELPFGLSQSEVDALIATHAAAADPHTGYQKESEKGAANGYASLGADTLVPQSQLGSGAQDGTKFLRDDGTWQTLPALTAALDDLSDVVIATPADGQVLTYDSATSEWKNENSASGFSNPMTTEGDLIKGGTAGAAERLAIGTDGHALRSNGTTPVWEADRATINFIIDGGGSAIATGIKGDIVIDFACVIESATVLLDQSGSIVVDVWKDTYANYPPVDADSITAAAPPTVSAATKSQDTTLTGWTTSIAAGDTLRFNVDSAATATRATVSLKVRRT